MSRSTRSILALAVIGLVVAALLGGCERGLAVPSGAQVVHVSVTRSSVRIDPPTLHAGTVYLVTESDGAELIMIAGGAPGAGGPLGLTDEHLDAVLHGDLFLTYQESGFPSGGQMGNTSLLGELSVGKYLFLPAGIVDLAPQAYDSIPSGAFAVLEVVS